jgi:hypothetical protein
MPFSNGQWDTVHRALSIQRDSIDIYKSNQNNLVACFRSSLFYHTLSTPIQYDLAAEGYMKVIEGHAGHNASLHFSIGILLLSGVRCNVPSASNSNSSVTWKKEEFMKYMKIRMAKMKSTKRELLEKEDNEQWDAMVSCTL